MISSRDFACGQDFPSDEQVTRFGERRLRPRNGRRGKGNGGCTRVEAGMSILRPLLRWTESDKAENTMRLARAAGLEVPEVSDLL